ncbi:MAG: DUF1028 domain-containing protein [Bacteroidia bacterium]
MKKKLFFTLFSCISTLFAQDTFSIVAADSATQEVGSAGASCVDLVPFVYPADFLGDLIPMKGAINTQAAYLGTNQANARARMNAGDTPQQIIDWLVSNDAQGNPLPRQYGVVGFVNGTVEAVGYTGSGCMDVKYHKTGKVNGIAYSIQGNILLGQQIIDSMEARFLAQNGDLRCKLMAALQGANVVGADTRCAQYGTSALFAFVKVSKPTDNYTQPYFKLGVKASASAPFEPIDSLQTLFNAQYNCATSSMSEHILPDMSFAIFPNPAQDACKIVWNGSKNEKIEGVIYNGLGQKMHSFSFSKETTLNIQDWQTGLYWVEISDGKRSARQKLMKR